MYRIILALVFGFYGLAACEAHANVVHAPLKSFDSDLCVDTNGNAVCLQRCVDERTSQSWGRTLQGEIRSVGYPTKCLDVSGAKISNGTQVILFRCHGGKSRISRLRVLR